MVPPSTPDGKVVTWLRALGVESLTQWDVLVFMHRHRASLVSAEHIARLVGHETGAVVTALDCLEALGLVERSRVSRTARLYEPATPPEPPRDEALRRLLEL